MTDASERAIAIVGVSAILPDAPDVARFWQNLKDGRYSISEVPAERWDPASYYDPDPSAPEKTYSKIGGWVRDWEWNPMGWHLPIPPKVADAMDESQKWAVACARSALLDSGHPDRALDPERTAVVVGTAMAGDRHYWTSLRIFFPEYAAALSEAPSFAALPEAVRETIARETRERMAERLPGITEDSMPGELANCMAGRIANLFDLHGPNFVCDAACASALAAIDAAKDGLLTGEYDSALVGGVDRNMGPAPFVKFCKIGALSATGTRPYGEGADGFVMGEGAAFFVLKRLADAEAQGDRIYAVLRGVGGSSDGRGKGITAPNPAGQRLAIERAWRDAGLSPASAGLVEGHGTSTRVGDVVEVGALSDVFGAAGAGAGQIALGSVKSNIGHLKGAAGAAGLLKTILALHDKTLPPSLHCEKPNPNIDFAASPFVVNTECKPWDAGEEGVRRAGVSAFGFGGTNYHAVLEEYLPGRLASGARVGASGRPESAAAHVVELAAPPRGALMLGAADAAGLVRQLEPVLAEAARGGAAPAGPPAEAALRAAERLAIDYEDAAELAAKGARARKALEAPSGDQPGLWKALRSQGIFRGGGPAPKVAFLYTGQGSQYVNMLRGLRESEPVVADTFAEADRVLAPLLGRPLSEFLFVDPHDEAAVSSAEAELRKTEITQPAVLTVDVALTRLLAGYGLVPDMVMGHSLGEYGALVASGALPFGDALQAVSARGREMASLSLEDNGRMAAVLAPLDEIQATLEAVDGNVVVANLNSNSQAVIGGATAPVEAAMERLKEAGHQVVPLNVSHAFHTSIVAPASEPLRRTLERLRLAPPEIPLVANVNGEPYPVGPDALPRMLDLLAAQVASPVQFVKGLETLHDLGARVFVEMGPKKALHGFVSDVLGGREGVVPLFTNHPKVGDAASVNQALCGLWAAGLGVGARAAESVEATPQPTHPVQQPTALPSAPGAGEDRFADLGRLFAEFLERGAAIMGRADAGGARSSAPPVVTGASLGLPGRERVFADDNVQKILDGEQEIDLIPTRFRHAMVDKHITRLVKTGGDPHFESIESSADVIKLAARAGALDLAADFGVPADRIPALDVATRLAMAAGVEALRDAGIPLVMHYRTTTKGTQLPERWMLPEPLRDETGVIFASAFPGFDSFADELERWSEERLRQGELEVLHALRGRIEETAAGSEVLATEIARRIHELEQAQAEHPYAFDRRFLFRILPMAHAQFAEYVGARGPNTHVNSACASTTQAFALAEDWIAAGRCRRVVILAADDATSDHLLEWIGTGFLATGAAATDDVVEDAALPFDRRRHGMILGMGAAGIVVEAPECASERGLRPICEVISTVTANSAFHGTRLDVDHIGDVMERVVRQAEERLGIDRHTLAEELLFVSHETYTPARGGSASAEVEALRRVFGEQAGQIVVANTKGLTGHPMGVGIEDVVAIKALETGIVPPVPNYREPDPELGPLHLSRGGAYPIRWALRLGAGFGSQISMSLLRWTPSPDGARPASDALGHTSRLADASAFRSWVASMSGDPEAELELVQRTLRVRDRSGLVREAPGAPALSAPAPAGAVPAAAAQPDPVAERVLAIVSEKTGYPPEMLDLDLDLEADLGIDTVKQAETFAAIREAYDIPRDENLQLRDYPTLAHAIGFVRERRPDLAAAPAGTTTPEADSALSDDEAEIRARVLAIVSEKTGYPPEMLDLDLDLEADLGIDTVKQAETFAAIREAYDIPRDENLQLRDYPTLAHAIGFVQERRPDLAAAPAGTTTPEADSASSDDEAEIRARVLAIVSEKTGYPPEMLDLDLDLEADLGIDTVKQAETFAAIREAYDIPRDENLQLRDYPTLAHAIGFVQERRPAAGAAVSDEATGPALRGEVEPHAPEGDSGKAAALAERVPIAVVRPPRPLCKGTGVQLGEGSRVLLMSDRGGVGRALARRLEQRGVQVLPLEAEATTEEMARRVEGLLGEGPIQGVYWLPALDAEGSLSELDPGTWRAALHLRLKLLVAALRALGAELAAPEQFLVCATRLGGRHGYDAEGARNPLGGAVTGFAKALARERPELLVKAVDFPETRRTAELADALLAETEQDPGAVEIGIDGELRFSVALEDAPAPQADGGILLGEGTVFLVTGAAGSIVSAIVADLASAGGGVFHLVDLVPEPERSDPDIARFESDREGLKRALFERLREQGERGTPVQIERELARIERAHAALAAIRAVEAHAGEVHWHQVDLTDGGAVAKVVEEIRDEAGCVDVLLHAAGLERSRQLLDKPPDEFELVFGVKCDGWFHLLHALGDLPVGAVVFFSSISGRFGNAGQTDYSAANDLLCKLASHWRSARPDARAVALDWTAWGGIGMAARGSIPDVMARAGIDMLDPEAGIPFVRRVLTEGGPSGEILVAQRLGVMLAERDETGGLDPSRLEVRGRGPLLGAVTGAGLHAGLTVVTTLDPGAQPFLDHHRIDGTAVLPGVMGVEAFAEAAQLLFPTWHVAAVEDVAFLAPFKFYRDEPRDVEVRCRFLEDGHELLAECGLWGRRLLAGQSVAQETLHFRGRVRLAPEPATDETIEVPPPAGDRALEAEDLYRVYFHGPAYRVLSRAWRAGDRVVGAFAEGLAPAHDPADRPLTTRPRLLELCFQTAGAWEIASSGRMGLPERFARVRFGARGAAEGALAVLTVTGGDELRRVQVVDPSGRLLVALEGYQTAALPQSLPEDQLSPLARALR